MKKVAIITVDFNRHDDTREFLESYSKLNRGKYETRVFVIDNGSNKLPQIPRELGKEAEIIETGKNLGFAGGYNLGWKYAAAWGADYLLIINNDVLFNDKTLLDKLIGVLKTNPEAGVVSPKILFAPGYEFYDRYTAEESGKVLWYAGGSFDWDNIYGKHRGIDEVDKGQYDQTEETGFVSGCCMMVTRETFEMVGGFDERLFAYFEDNDWMQRLGVTGKKMYYCGQASIFHKVSQTAKVGSEFTDYLLTRNRLVFADRYAKLRTRMALWREAVKLSVWGRPAQKRGIKDYMLGKRGYETQTNFAADFPMELSIITVNYKTKELLDQLLESIFAKGSGYDATKHEVVVVDNGSEDGCAEMMAKKYPKVKFVPLKVNTGFAGGNNVGINYARGKYVLLLNSDIVVHKRSLTRLIREANALGGKAVLVGKLRFPDGTIQDSCFKLPSVSGAIKEYFWGEKGSYFMFAPKGKDLVKVEGAVMACFMIPRTILSEIGIIDEGSFLYFEDIEYCRRLKQKRVPLYYVPGSVYTHYHGAASKKIGLKQATDYLKKGSLYYHGRFKYTLLYIVLWLGQRWGRTITPEARWKKETEDNG